MSIILSSTADRLQLVHACDPDVELNDGETRTAWIPLSEVKRANPGATIVTIRPLNGREMLNAWAKTGGDQDVAILSLGVALLNDAVPKQSELMLWSWDVIGGLARTIEEISRGPTAARR